MPSIDTFISRIDDFILLSKSQQLDFFCYYLQTQVGADHFTVSDITACYKGAGMQKYSNIGQYLRTYVKPGKKQKFIKHEKGFLLERIHKEYLSGELGDLQIKAPHDESIIPYIMFENTRGYLKKIIHQSIICYDNQAYDGCSVLIRKCLEILIIECFEKYKIESRIQNENKDFLYLSDLIDCFTSAPEWNIGRNAKASLKKIKSLGDQAAHNRRFLTNRADLDKNQDDMRIVFEELILLNSY